MNKRNSKPEGCGEKARIPTPPIEQGRPPISMSIANAARELGISKSKMYQLINDGEVPTFKIGPKRRLVRYEELVAYARQQG